MHKKYTTPLSIFVIFENTNVILWTSDSFQPNSYIVYFNQIWFFSINIFLKKDLFLSNSFLFENTAVDFKKNFKSLNHLNNNINITNEIVIIYMYYFFFLKTKLTFMLFYNKKYKINSIDCIFKSANWLEREVSEMFKIVFKNKTDKRRLLLDYSKQENPLLKSFPSEGFTDVFYNFFENQTLYTCNSTVEL